MRFPKEYTEPEAAELLGMTQQWMRKKRIAKSFPHFRKGRQIFYTKQQIHFIRKTFERNFENQNERENLTALLVSQIHSADEKAN